MEPPFNPYAELDLPKTATPAQINAAFRRKSKKAHPDAGGNHETFSRLSKAVAILRDPNRRAHFDQTGFSDEPPQENLAHHVLVQAFVAAISNTITPEFVDIIDKTKKIISNQKRTLTEQLNQINAHKAKIANSLKRLHHNSNTPNILANVLEHQLQEAQNHASDAQNKINAHTQAITLAETYSWEYQSKPAQNVTATSAVHLINLVDLLSNP